MRRVNVGFLRLSPAFVMLACSACRLDNPAFKSINQAAPIACKNQNEPGCNDPNRQHQNSTTSTTSGSPKNKLSSKAPTLSDTSSGTLSSQAGSEANTKEQPLSSATTDTTNSGQLTSSPETLPSGEFPLDCGNGMTNCYTMKFDVTKNEYASRGSGPINFKNAVTTSPMQVRSAGSSGGAFMHYISIPGSGHGATTAPFSLAGFDGIGIEMLVRNLRCASNEICYFAGFKDIFFIGFSPSDSKLFCNTQGQKGTGIRVSSSGEVLIACSLSRSQLKFAVNKNTSVISAGQVLSKVSTVMTLGPSLNPSVAVASGAMVEVGWIRIWHDANMLASMSN